MIFFIDEWNQADCFLRFLEFNSNLFVIVNYGYPENYGSSWRILNKPMSLSMGLIEGTKRYGEHMIN